MDVSPRMSPIKPLLLLATALAFVISPFFVAPFSGFDPQSFPVPTVDPPIQPAGYAFSIWSLIYAGLLVHAVFGLAARRTDIAWDAVRWPLFVSLGLGATWLGVAAMEPVGATVIIWAMLGSGLLALSRAPYIPDRWLLLGPIALYAGWLTAAAAVSLGVVLIGYGFLSEFAATLAMLVVVLAVALATQLLLGRAPEYGAAVVWALIGVVVANWGGNWIVALIAAVGAVVMAGAVWHVARQGAYLNRSG